MSEPTVYYRVELFGTVAEMWYVPINFPPRYEESQLVTAQADLARERRAGRKVRLVRVTEEVVSDGSL